MRVCGLFAGRSLLNKPIVARDSGALLGRVQDVVFDYAQNQVLAFLVDKRWRVESRVLPWSGLYSVAVDGLVAHNAAMLTQAVNLLAVHRVFSRANVRRGTRLALQSGRDLGRVRDVYFDVHGVLAGYLTFLDKGDPGARALFVPAARFIQVDGTCALLPDDHARLLDERPAARRRLEHGLKLLASDLWKKQALPAQAHDAAPAALVGALADAALHLTEGCRVGAAVLSSEGLFAAVAGEIMTAHSVERVRACDRAREVLAACGADLAGALRAAGNGDMASV